MQTQRRTQRVLADRYVLNEVLGAGGMGVVWRAEDRLLQRTVAVKEVALPQELSRPDRDAVQARVLREARAAARLTHPVVVTVFDVLQEEGTAYIVMEFVAGRTLAEIVDDAGPMRPDRVARIGIDLLGALEKAHTEGIVHRDVKPANVMVDSEGRVKLADFGIASLKGDAKLTQTGALLGSPSFMAPEQAQDLASGPPADHWALGATLYMAVEGRPPFDRGKPIPTLTSVVYDDPQPFDRAGPLAPVISSLLVKDPQARASGPGLRGALEEVARGAPAARRRAVRPTPLETPARRREDVWTRRPLEPEMVEAEREPAEPRSVAWALLAGAALVVALLAGALWLALTRDTDSPPTAARSAASEPKDGNKPRGDVGSSTENGQSDSGGESTTPSAATDDTTETTPVEPATGQIPADWVTYTDPEGGYRIAHPPGWQVVEDTSGPNSIDIREPGTGTYLRVAWTDSPGPDPQAAWEGFAPKFAATHTGYKEVGITPTSYRGYTASLWEFLWSSGDARLHAYDLGFVTGEQGYALNFQAHEENWESSQPLWDAFKASFEPPA